MTPVCDRCHKPVERSPDDVWRHALTEDYHGPCWWGKPWPFGQLGPGLVVHR